MKKFLTMFLVLVLVLGVVTACSKQPASTDAQNAQTTQTTQTTQSDAPNAVENTTAPAPADTRQQVTLNFMLNSPEITDQYNDMAAAYMAENTNVTINMDILQNDYQTVLKTRINSGDIPDVFLTSAYNDNKVFKDYSYILNNESFMSNFEPAILASVTLDGQVTGLPFLVQAHSFIYNKVLFEQAGITDLPVTLDDYRDVCARLNAAGIQPFGSGFAEWWVLPQTTYPMMSDAYNGDYDRLFADVESGSLKFGDLPQVDFALDMLDLIKENSGDKPMESSFDLQVSDFATGKAAMIHQGTWAEGSIRDITPDIDIGFLKHPRLDNQGVIAVESNLTFRIYKDSPNLAEVLKFFDWLTGSEYGKSWIPEKIKQGSPLAGAPAPDTQLEKVSAAAQAEKITCPWWIFKGPDGIEEPFGTAFQKYVAGTSNRNQVKAELSQLFVDAYEAQSD